MTTESFVDGPDRLRSDILRICSRLLESTDLTIDDDFFDKGGDSLLATELMLELRQLTGKALPDSLLFESSTVRSLAKRLSEKEAPRPNMAVRVGPVSDGAAPLLFFHGDWSWGGFYVEHLARKLGSGISLIAIAPHGAGGEPIPPSIEEMAADRLPAILEAQPTGPYRLAGHCVGGIVALETARLLMKLNHRVETVVMIDSPVMMNGGALKAPAFGATERVKAPDDIPIRPATPFGPAFELYTERLATYSPTPLSVRLLVLASEYDGRDWVRLSKDAHLVEIPGDHFDLVTFRINELASRLRSWLSGDISAGLGESHPPTGAEGHETSRARMRNRESEEFQTPQIGPSNSLSRRLRSFLNYARR
jgi:pimeloyl-ACP methyl ester carboxylesterase